MIRSFIAALVLTLPFVVGGSSLHVAGYTTCVNCAAVHVAEIDWKPIDTSVRF